jgi:hypothetical protein
MASGPASIKDCLQAGLRSFRRRPLRLILSWGAAVGATALFVSLIPADLSSALQVGASIGGMAILWAQLDLLRALREDISEAHRSAKTLRDWAWAFVPAIVAPALFRLLTWSVWFAVPFTGVLMYAFFSYGFGDMFLCGRLDLLTSAILFGFAGFMMTCGLLFAPLCAVVDRIGPLEALRRSWRMVGGHRLKILGISAACLSLPIATSLAAYYISILEARGMTFRGLPAVLWTASAASVALFFGPWLTASVTILLIPLKREENVFVRRLIQRRTTMNLS